MPQSISAPGRIVTLPGILNDEQPTSWTPRAITADQLPGSSTPQTITADQQPRSSMSLSYSADLQPGSSNSVITPESIRPYPKAGPRNPNNKGGRKKLSSTILTDTPIKERIREEQAQRKLKKSKNKKVKAKNLAAVFNNVTNMDVELDDPNEADDLGVSQLDDMDISSDSEVERVEDNFCVDTDNDDVEFDSDTVKADDWCLFEYMFDSKVFYVGKIIVVNEKKVTAKFLQFVNRDRECERANFVEKSNGGIEEADIDQIVLKLDAPTQSAEATKRRSAFIKFPFNFSSYNLGI